MTEDNPPNVVNLRYPSEVDWNKRDGHRKRARASPRYKQGDIVKTPEGRGPPTTSWPDDPSAVSG